MHYAVLNAPIRRLHVNQGLTRQARAESNYHTCSNLYVILVTITDFYVLIVLLHCLIHSSVLVKEHLNEYFIRSSRALSLSTIDRNVCLLIVKCFEVCNNFYKVVF